MYKTNKLKKKPWIPAFPLGISSTTVCLPSQGNFMLVLVNDFIKIWLAWILTHWASEFQKVLVHQENLLVPDYRTGNSC